MRESDARKDGGTYGEHTTQYDEDRYQDEPEGKREDQAQAAPAHTHTQVDQAWPLAACIDEVWQQWHAVPFDNAHMNFAVRSLFYNREQIAQTRAACDALAEALRDLMREYCPMLSDRKGTASKAHIALAQWEEAKK